MKPWPIIRLTLIHCALALGVSALFALTLYALRFLYPADSAVVWWAEKIDLILAIFTPTALAVAFVSSVLRIILDAVILSWKGFPHDGSNLVLV